MMYLAMMPMRRWLSSESSPREKMKTWAVGLVNDTGASLIGGVWSLAANDSREIPIGGFWVSQFTTLEPLPVILRS